MRKILELSKARKTVTLALIAPLLLSLCACASKGETPVAYEVSNLTVPSILTEPTPGPEIVPLDSITDIDLGVLTQNDEKALEACNADKAKIKELLKESSTPK